MTDVAAEIEALRAALAEAGRGPTPTPRRPPKPRRRRLTPRRWCLVARPLIAHLKLEIEKLRRELYGQRSERKQRLLDQLELQLEEMETTASEDEALAAAAAEKAKTTVGPSSGASRSANRSPNICPASASCCPRPATAPPAARRG